MAERKRADPHEGAQLTLGGTQIDIPAGTFGTHPVRFTLLDMNHEGPGNLLFLFICHYILPMATGGVREVVGGTERSNPTTCPL
jgi:hypothetical protein